jgi:hypothetical protein
MALEWSADNTRLTPKYYCQHWPPWAVVLDNIRTYFPYKQRRHYYRVRRIGVLQGKRTLWVESVPGDVISAPRCL